MSAPNAGYQPLKFDVRNILVPSQWQDCPFEYRHGYGMGLERDGVNNPVSHKTQNEAQSRGETDPREAWFAGYRAGKRARPKEAPDA